MKDRRVIGKNNKANGAMLEDIISFACRYYLDKQVAHIEKTPEPFHIVQRKGGFVSGFYEKCAQPDYKGVLCDGTGVIFESKYTSSDRIQQNVITDKQKESLEAFFKFNAHCFVIVSLGFQDYYRVPWKVWRNMKELFKHKYMNRNELEPYRIQYKYGKLLFLEGLELRD